MRKNSNKFEEETIAARVAIGEMIIDKYQGNVNQNIVNKIAEKWDDSAAGCVILSLRNNGEYAVLDGQHRVLAAKKVGVAELPALVFIDKTYEEEAKLFVMLNTKHNVSVHDRFRANLIGGSIREKTVNNIAKELGLHINHNVSNNPLAIRSVVSVLNIYDGFGASHLKLVLGTLQAAFGAYKDTSTYSSEAIMGTSQFIHRFPEAKISLLIEKLKKYSPSTIVGMSAQRRDPNQARWAGWGRAITMIYNQGFSNMSKNKMPMERWDKTMFSPVGRAKQAETGRKSLEAIRKRNLENFKFQKGVPKDQQPSMLAAAARAPKS